MDNSYVNYGNKMSNSIIYLSLTLVACDILLGGEITLSIYRNSIILILLYVRNTSSFTLLEFVVVKVRNLDKSFERNQEILANVNSHASS